ncbi:hypothetical protein EDC14_103832 [Hydrogenispora ethanolica]|uniref:Uncharacterized protein n=1 Tax=Hydrogenispora ethanolica TaxID=1082276 RepID=A0A4R1R2X8_HYDET|nr:hypothetical protein EDC14_103832 [Hydrogenispora ethanolica]
MAGSVAKKVTRRRNRGPNEQDPRILFPTFPYRGKESSLDWLSMHLSIFHFMLIYIHGSTSFFAVEVE